MLHVTKNIPADLAWDLSGGVWILIRGSGGHGVVENWLRWSEWSKQYVGYQGVRYGIDLERAKAAMVEEAERKKLI